MKNFLLDDFMVKINDLISSGQTITVGMESNKNSCLLDLLFEDCIRYDDAVEMLYGNSHFSLDATNVEYDEDEACFIFNNNAYVYAR